MDQAKVAEALRARGGFVERQEANCSMRLDFAEGGERAIVRQFTNGTLTLQLASSDGGEASPLFAGLHGRIVDVLGESSGVPNGAARPGRPSSPEVDPAEVFTGSLIGTDEAGKGDYFGPLVSAAVFVDEQSAERLRVIGVRDSKLLSDAQVRQLAGQVRQMLGESAWSVVEIGPQSYNQLLPRFRQEGKSLNTLLAWGHARAIENLFQKGVTTTNILVDQFTDVAYIKARLLTEARARHVNLVAMPRAEANVAVAAASVLARDRFLSWLRRTSAELGSTVPKGAAPAADNAARAIVARYGAARLEELVKLHFKNTQRVLSGTTAGGPASG
jgi:ribonuclease HIII